MKGKIAIIIILMLVSVGLFSGCIFYDATILLDVETKANDLYYPPYDISKLETILSRNDTTWIVVVKFIDVDSNTTIYDEYVYNLKSKSLTPGD